MAIDQRPNVDTALLAGRVPYNSGLYVIGPFAERVSFASQQRRALSLVWAIHEELCASGVKDGLEGLDVGIVGAGLAGLTCSLGLAAFKCNVWIMEKRESALAAMLRATHRDVHPTVNFWPREDLQPTTELPFLNWYRGPCNKVLERIHDQWKQLRSRSDHLIKRITTDCTIDRITRAGGKWVVESTCPSLRKREFDILILATGFGKEAGLAGTDRPGYWDAEQDRIQRVVGLSDLPVQNYVVSGTGDGGLIEALRLVYAGFRAGSIESATAELLGNRDVKLRIKAIERETRQWLADNLLHGKLSRRPKARRAEIHALKDEAAASLWEGYSKLVLDDLLGDNLGPGMARTSVPKVILVGKHPAPTETTASPYHKLLISFAISQNLMEYHQTDGTMSVTADRRPSRPEQAEQLGIKPVVISYTALRTISGADGRFVYDSDLGRHTIRDSLYVCRHGYESPLIALAKKSQIFNLDFIRTNQSLYADQDWLTMDQADHFALGVKLTAPSVKHLWMQDHAPDAAKFFKQFGLSIIPEVDPPRYVLTRDGLGADPQRRAQVTEAIPQKFFGVDVDSEDIGGVPVSLSREGHE